VNEDALVNEIKTADPDIVEARDRAKEKLIGTNKVGLYSDLIKDYWHYDIVVKGTGTVDDYKGQWLKFDDNQEYSKGGNGKKLEKGKWNYNSTNEVLTLLPDNQSLMPSEFRLMSKANTIICVGTPDFKNNDTQMKLVNSPELPASNG
jgi:hypothetical protein